MNSTYLPMIYALVGPSDGQSARLNAAIPSMIGGTPGGMLGVIQADDVHQRNKRSIAEKDTRHRAVTTAIGMEIEATVEKLAKGEVALRDVLTQEYFAKNLPVLTPLITAKTKDMLWASTVSPTTGTVGAPAAAPGPKIATARKGARKAAKKGP